MSGVIVVTGASGVGKSTFVQLLAGILSPVEGHVILTDYRGKALPVEDCTSSILYLHSDPWLVHGSIRENLLLGKLVPESRLEEVLRLVGLFDFFEGLRDGTESKIGVDGLELSSGQLQRLNIARALLRTLKILVLDEASNALDITSETSLLSQVARNLSHSLILVVTHRPQSIKLPHKTVSLADGKVTFSNSLVDQMS